MKTEKINFIFSILFFIGCISFTGFLWESFKQQRWFKNDFFSEIKCFKNETELFIFCGVVIFATFFNILAYKLRCPFLYLIAAVGFMLFTFVHSRNIWGQVNEFIYKSRILDVRFVNGVFFGFPLGLFGLITTLHCFEKTYNEKMKDEKLFINLGMKDYTKCITFFHAASIFTIGLYSYVMARDYGFEDKYFFALPIIIASLVFETQFDMKKRCVVALYLYGIIAAFSIIGFGALIYNNIVHYHSRYILMDFFGLTTLLLTITTHIFIGIATTLHLYREAEKQNSEIKSLITFPDFVSKTSTLQKNKDFHHLI